MIALVEPELCTATKDQLVLTDVYVQSKVMSEKQQQLVFSIIDFLKHSLDDGTVKQDDKEGLEVASAHLLSNVLIFRHLTVNF
jgi:hypothetical protein